MRTRKIFAGLVLFSGLVVAIAPLAVSAQVTPQECCKINRKITIGTEVCGVNEIAQSPGYACPIAGTVCPTGTTGTEKWGLFCIFNTISVIVDWIFVILLILAVLFSILGAFNYLTSAGDPQKTKAGREYLLYAAIGLIVGLIARAIPGIVKSVIGY